jgi:methionyl-tRNA synthetase
MISTKLNKTQMSEFYNVLCQDLIETTNYKVPFDGILGILEKGKRSEPHAHHEAEIFILLNGEGTIGNKIESEEMVVGNVYFSPPFEDHWLENKGEGDMVFMSMWWNHESNLGTSLEEYIGTDEALQETKLLVTATPPTPNGDLHIGHLSGPFLNSDIIKRIYELKGIPSYSVSGLDDHQNYVLLKAIQTNTTASDIATTKGNTIKETWRLGRIDYDFLIDAQDKEYKIFIDEFFKDLYKKGVIEEKETEVFFDENGKYIFEAFIRGECPHCGAESDGLACEQCGMPNDCTDLINPVSKISNTLVKRKVKRLFLKTEKFKKQLEDFLSKLDLSYKMVHLKNTFLDVAPEIAITHPAEWGINSTIEGYEDQVYYVWAEMAPAFLYASIKEEGFDLSNQEFWNDSKAKFIQCFGFDNAYFYMFLFPMLWLGYDKNIKLPDQFITNEFLCLEGSKFSTSRNHAIWGNDILSKTNADYLRLYLAYVGPSKRETNFVLDEFKTFSQELWIETLVPWIENLQRKLNTTFNNEIPNIGAWSKQHVHYFNTILESYNTIHKHFNASLYDSKNIVAAIKKIITAGHDFSFNENVLFLNDAFYNQQRTSVNLELNTLYYLGLVLYPIMPNVSKYIQNSFTETPEELPKLTHTIELKKIERFNLDVNVIKNDLRVIADFTIDEN